MTSEALLTTMLVAVATPQEAFHRLRKKKSKFLSWAKLRHTNFFQRPSVPPHPTLRGAQHCQLIVIAYMLQHK